MAMSSLTYIPGFSVKFSFIRFILIMQIRQQWTIEEISIFSNSSHLEWKTGLSNTKKGPIQGPSLPGLV
jgi:hypothetical protein